MQLAITGQILMSSMPLDLTNKETTSLLKSGDVVRGQRIIWSSNSTFLVHINAGRGNTLKAIYKPQSGEFPLSDFPNGTLYKRERAAFLISRRLGWPNVPITVIRDGPRGIGTMQLYVESDPRITYFDLVDDHFEQFMYFAAFDFLTNNADRKGGHCLKDKHGTIWSVDHGLTFHSAFKMRTVMLEFWGKKIPEHILADIASFSEKITGANTSYKEDLVNLISVPEIEALQKRADFLIHAPVIPQLDPHLNIPWPLE